MKPAAVVKTFSRKPKKAPPQAVVDFDTMRNPENASESSQDWTASQGDLPDSQQSVGNAFDVLLVDPAPEPAAATRGAAAAPVAAPLLARQAGADVAADREPSLQEARQPRKPKAASSLFTAMRQEAPAEKLAPPPPQWKPHIPAPKPSIVPRRPAAASQQAPSPPPVPPVQLQPALRKRKEQPSGSSSEAAASQPPRKAPVADGISAPRHNASSRGAASASLQSTGSESGGGTGRRPIGGSVSFGGGSALQRGSGSSQRSSGSSQGSQEAACPPASKRIAAITLVEAQDSGESVRIMDDLMYALDGLNAALPAATQQESAVAIAETALSQRGRMALRSEGALGDVLEAADGLDLRGDSVVACALGALLLSFSRQPQDLPVLATPHALSLLGKLLQPPDQPVLAMLRPMPLLGKLLQAGGGVAARNEVAAGAAERVMRGACEAAQLPTLARSPPAVALATFAGMMDPLRAASSADAAKRSVAEAGLLLPVALAADAALTALSGRTADAAGGDADADRLLWLAHQAMLVLEHATFASPDNEAAVVSLALPNQSLCASPIGGIDSGGSLNGCGGANSKADDSTSSSGEQPFPQWLLGHLGRGTAAAGASSATPGWVQAGLSVLMNVTHNNEAGRDAVAAGGGAEALVQLVGRSAAAALGLGGQDGGGDAELLSSGLGVLINLAEGAAPLRARLAAAPVTLPASSGGAAAQPAMLLSLLCSLVARTSQPVEGTPSPAARMRSPGGEELTAEQLERAETAGAASILQAYSAMLLGFLVYDDPVARAAAAAALPGGSLEPVAAAVEKCLHFYVTVGAMTADNEASLTALVMSLRRQEEG